MIGRPTAVYRVTVAHGARRASPMRPGASVVVRNPPEVVHAAMTSPPVVPSRYVRRSAGSCVSPNGAPTAAPVASTFTAWRLDCVGVDSMIVWAPSDAIGAPDTDIELPAREEAPMTVAEPKGAPVPSTRSQASEEPPGAAASSAQ